MTQGKDISGRSCKSSCDWQPINGIKNIRFELS
jgi:hypothetical protein